MSLTPQEKFKRELAMLALQTYDAIDAQMGEEMKQDVLRKLNALRADVLEYERLAERYTEHKENATALRQAFETWDSAVKEKLSLTDINVRLPQDSGKTGDPA